MIDQIDKAHEKVSELFYSLDSSGLLLGRLARGPADDVPAESLAAILTHLGIVQEGVAEAIRLVSEVQTTVKTRSEACTCNTHVQEGVLQ